MAENALRRFARLLGGVVLTQGHLGHQVLGELLIFDATEVEVAGANLAVAATSGPRNAFAQVAIRTAVPALAMQALLRNREKRLEARERRLAERAQRVSAANQDLQTQRQHIESSHAELQSSHADAAAKLAALDAENRKLREELVALRARPAEVPEPPRLAARATLPEPPPAASLPDEARVPPPTKGGGVHE